MAPPVRGCWLYTNRFAAQRDAAELRGAAERECDAVTYQVTRYGTKLHRKADPGFSGEYT